MTPPGSLPPGEQPNWASSKTSISLFPLPQHLREPAAGPEVLAHLSVCCALALLPARPSNEAAEIRCVCERVRVCVCEYELSNRCVCV
jgi:hypothetical protein